MTLEVRGLVKHFGGVQAVRGVSFTVADGQCVALIGPNGAGKSTTFACIAGQHRPTAGAMVWNGRRIDGLSPAERLARGISRTFQVAQVFDALTVLQNVQLLLQAPAGLSAWARLDACHAEQARHLLERVGLGALALTRAAGLAYGARKRLELALALAALGPLSPPPHAAPRLLLLDEPAAGLAAAERAALMELIRALVRSASLTVLYTEHNMDAVFGVADAVLVMWDGVLAAQASPADIAANPVVRSRYLGDHAVALNVNAAPHA